MDSTTEYKITLKKIWIHLSTICKHKWWVMYYCFKCGIPWQGIIHDLSKFSFTEFWTNVKYAVPGKSPIDVQKENIGFSMAWQHHKGHNPQTQPYHHLQVWAGCRMSTWCRRRADSPKRYPSYHSRVSAW